MVTSIASTGQSAASERVVPGKAPLYLFEKHASRYQFVREVIAGCRLLDIGCGDGYGSYYLAQHAANVTAIDIAPEVIAQAQERYRHPTLAFRVMDCTRLGFSTGHFDVITSFEMIEHVERVDDFLQETARVLAPNGTFFVSTPNKYGYVAAGHNPFHVTEYTLQEFRELLSRHFLVVEIYGQFCQRPLRRRLYQLSSRLYFSSRIYRGMILGLAPLYIRAFWGNRDAARTDWIDSVRPGLFAFSRDQPERADSFLAICRKGL